MNVTPTLMSIPLPPLNWGDTASIRLQWPGYKECAGPPSPSKRKVAALLVGIGRADLEEKKLSIEWQISCASSFPDEPSREDAPRKVLDYTTGVYAVDVFFPGAAATRHLGLDTFETKHKMQESGRFPAPFESYTSHHTSQIYAFAMDPVNNLTIEIARLSIPYSRGDLAISSHDAEATKQLKYDTDDGPTTVEVKSRVLTLTARYSTFTLALTASMYIANWALTLTSLYVTSSAVKTGRVTWSAFILHNAMALVVPSIRKLYLCPPPFGRFLETSGFISQMIILCFCSVTLLHALVLFPTTGK